MVNVSSPAIRQESSAHSVPEAVTGPAPATGTQIHAARLGDHPVDSCIREAIRYSDLVLLGSRVGRPWFRYARDGHYMVEVGWESGGPNTTHCLSELTVIRSSGRFACI
jgi:hypothetical protein